ncbi:MAG TPA: DUF2914 domain-containing protein [Gemmatimonadales bacterium]|nr:DUF2914 domain-containing protein [Gemmatimonadales bacterium]
MRYLTCMLALALAVPGALRAQDSTGAMPAPAAAAPAAAPAPMLSVVEAAIGTSVVDRVPQDTGSAFPASVGSLVCWTKISGAAGGAAVHHVWFHGDTQVGDMELQVGGSPWRTWSRKSVPADWTGPWHVEVRDAAGAVLKRLDFSVNAAAAPAPAPAAAPAPPPPNQ